MGYQHQLDATNTPVQSRRQDLWTLDSPAQNAVVMLRSVQRRTTNIGLDWSSYGMLGDPCRIRRELLTCSDPIFPQWFYLALCGLYAAAPKVSD